MKLTGWSMAAVILAGLGAGCVSGFSAQTQEKPQKPAPVRWTLAASAEQGPLVIKGAALTARLHAAIEPGWHIYALHEEPGGPTAMGISLPSRGPFAITGNLDAPTPKSAIDPGFGMETHFYTGNVEMTIPLRATRRTAGPVAIDVLYQACTREMCLPPSVAHLTAPVVKEQEEQP